MCTYPEDGNGFDGDHFCGKWLRFFLCWLLGMAKRVKVEWGVGGGKGMLVEWELKVVEGGNPGKWNGQLLRKERR